MDPEEQFLQKQGYVDALNSPEVINAIRQGMIGKIAVMQPQPELHIRADARAEYDSVGQVVLAAQQAGVARIGFLTEPPGR